MKSIVQNYNLYTPKRIKPVTIMYDDDGEWIIQKDLIRFIEYKLKEDFNSEETLRDLLFSLRHYNSRPEKRKRTLTQTNKIAVAAEQEWRCGGCKQLLTVSFEVHHIQDFAKGGSDDRENLVALCRNCHGDITITNAMKPMSGFVPTFIKKEKVKSEPSSPNNIIQKKVVDLSSEKTEDKDTTSNSISKYFRKDTTAPTSPGIERNLFNEFRRKRQKISRK
tara:strand:- start:46 stop:708 length:663 start_codon:yes stop_codon:yes gene_type:complete